MKTDSCSSKTIKIRGSKRLETEADGQEKRAVLGFFMVLICFQGCRMVGISDPGNKFNTHNELRPVKTRVLVIDCERGGRRTSRPSVSNVAQLSRGRVVVAPSELTLIITDFKFNAAKLARELITDTAA
jgi:hypothetical protein